MDKLFDAEDLLNDQDREYVPMPKKKASGFTSGMSLTTLSGISLTLAIDDAIELEDTEADASSSKKVTSDPRNPRKSALQRNRPLTGGSNDDLLPNVTESSGFLKGANDAMAENPIEREPEDSEATKDLGHFLGAAYAVNKIMHRRCSECM